MADSNTYSFRTALQGFNRADVVHFIEQNTAAHEAELRQLQLENSRLAQQLNDANDEGMLAEDEEGNLMWVGCAHS